MYIVHQPYNCQNNRHDDDDEEEKGQNSSREKIILLFLLVFVGFSMSRPYKRNHRYHVLAGSITNKYLFRLNENMIRRESM